MNIVVVDNNSIERDIDNITDKFPDVYYIKSHVNGGFSKGNNLGIQYAITKSADYIFILNNDTTVNNDCISKLVKFMEIKQTAIAASPLVMYGDDPDLIWFGGGGFKWKQGGARSYRLNVDINNTNLYVHEKIEFISGCAMFIRTNALQNAKWFDENFFMYVEDVDLSIRLNKIGDIYLIPSAKILHYVHSTLRKNGNNDFKKPLSHLNTNLNFYLENIIRGYFYLLVKHKPLLHDKIGFYIYFYLRWIKQFILYLFKGKFDSSLLILKILFTSQKKS